MTHLFRILALWAFAWPISCFGQGTFRITFDGPPPQPTNSDYTLQNYYEGGMWFRPLQGSAGFGRTGGGLTSLFPYDGSPYLHGAFGDSLAFSFQTGSLFGVFSVDLAGYSTVVPDFTVDFVGYRSDGSTISTSFSGNGIDFRTVNFGPDWSSGLTRVEIPNYGWSLDNLVVSIPEPSAGALVLVGTLAFGFWRMKKEKIP